MRFMLLMIPRGYESASPDAVQELDPERVDAMMTYNEALEKAGVLVALAGLHPPSMGARVSFSGGTPRVTRGPFPGVDETVGGYWLIRVASPEEAIEWAQRCPASDNEVIEIRQVQEVEDFAEDVRKTVTRSPVGS